MFVYATLELCVKIVMRMCAWIRSTNGGSCVWVVVVYIFLYLWILLIIIRSGFVCVMCTSVGTWFCWWYCVRSNLCVCVCAHEHCVTHAETNTLTHTLLSRIVRFTSPYPLALHACRWLIYILTHFGSSFTMEHTINMSTFQKRTQRFAFLLLLLLLDLLYSTKLIDFMTFRLCMVTMNRFG